MCLKTVRVLVEASCRGRCLAYIMPDKTLIVYQFGIIDQQQALPWLLHLQSTQAG